MFDISAEWPKIANFVPTNSSHQNISNCQPCTISVYKLQKNVPANNCHLRVVKGFQSRNEKAHTATRILAYTQLQSMLRPTI